LKPHIDAVKNIDVAGLTDYQASVENYPVDIGGRIDFRLGYRIIEIKATKDIEAKHICQAILYSISTYGRLNGVVEVWNVMTGKKEVATYNFKKEQMIELFAHLGNNIELGAVVDADKVTRYVDAMDASE